MTPRLRKRLVSTYTLPVATYAIPVCVENVILAIFYKHKLQSLLDRGVVRWAVKAHYFVRNQTVRSALGVRSLNATIKSIFRKFYRRAARFQGNPFVSGFGRY